MEATGEAEAPDETAEGTEEAEAVDEAITLSLTVKDKTRFTNGLFHYVYFDAQVIGAEKVTLQLLNPSGENARFRTRKHVNEGHDPVKTAGYALKAGQETLEDLNILFPSKSAPGVWQIVVTATAEGREPAVEMIPVEIQPVAPLDLPILGEARAMVDGATGREVLSVEAGRIRYICQDTRDVNHFVRKYWYSDIYNLLDKAGEMCSRAVFSMALSYLGIDLTPVRMSELVRVKEIEYSYDAVCKKLGNVTRVSGDLETLWAAYEAGEASPVLLHFAYEGGIHAVLLIARDPERPELFYAVTPGQRVNTTAYTDGMRRDVILPLLIEEGVKNGRIQSPMIARYHKGVIDQIWQWKIAEE